MKKTISKILILVLLASVPLISRADRPRTVISVPENTIPTDDSNELGEKSENLISNWVTSLSFSDDDQYLWAGTLRGLSRLDMLTGEFDNFTYENGLPADGVYSVWAGAGQSGWIGTSDFLARYDGEKWLVMDEPQGFEKHRAMVIKEDDLGNIWFGTNDGLWQYNESKSGWRFYRTGDGNTPFKESTISSLAINGSTLWVGGSELYSFVPPSSLGQLGDWQRHVWEEGFAKVITSLAVASDGSIWVGTNRGVWIFRDQEWKGKYTETDGLIDDAVNVILIDKSGNKWFGTDKGISRLGFDGIWKSYTTIDGMVNDTVMTMTLDSNDELWIGTLGGISHFDGLAWENFQTDGRTVYDPTLIAEEQDEYERQEFVQDFPMRDLAGHWARDYFVDLIRRGIISGFDDGSYRPDAPVSRSEALKMILGAAGYEVDRFDAYDFSFLDVAKKSWLAPYLNVAVENGIVESRDYFRPEDRATRAEVATMIVKAFNLNADGGDPIEFFDVPVDHPAREMTDILSASGIAEGFVEDVAVTIDEYDLSDRYDFRLAHDLGMALFDLGFFSLEQVTDYYTRDLFNALSGYQKQVVYGSWNWNFGYPDEETRQRLSENHIVKTEERTEKTFHPDVVISRAEVAKMLKVLWDKRIKG